MDDQKFELLEKTLHLNFNNKTLFKNAFIHRSYPNEHIDLKLNHNERLEFLGDAVIELIITDYLYNQFTEESEGTMTSYRAALVRTENLAMIAKNLNLHEYILMSKGEISGKSNENESVLADTLEALIGSIYLDLGITVVREFIMKYILVTLTDILEEKKFVDPKTHLQAIIQEKHRLTPEYFIVDESGKDHEKVFTAEVKSGDKVLGKGTGKSKQLAETNAARDALTKIN